MQIIESLASGKYLAKRRAAACCDNYVNFHPLLTPPQLQIVRVKASMENKLRSENYTREFEQLVRCAL